MISREKKDEPRKARDAELEFLWGVASSGYQCEGGYNGPGQPQNNWTHAESSGYVMATGAAADFWNRFEEDFDRCRELGLRAFRLSIEWARVQPSAETRRTEPPDFDFDALDKYAEILASCRRHGMEPVVTMQHFTHPAWLGQDAWLDDATPDLFARFVAGSTERLNRRLVEVHGQPPTLESAFMAYTGRSLDEDVEEDASGDD